MEKFNALFDHRFDCIKWTTDRYSYMYIIDSDPLRRVFGVEGGVAPHEMRGLRLE
jgi:hypothetical protein